MKNSTLRLRTFLKRATFALFTLALGGFSSNVANAQCLADAGTLSGFKPTDCLQQPNGTLIGGIPNGDAVEPAGYSTIWVLTEGPGLVIQQAGNSPIFTVNAIGNYTVHTLVYDPNTLDLSTVVFGTTTGFDVNGLLVQGGGSICASLDVAGTSILVDNPDAGQVAADSAQFCLMNGSATVTATPDGNLYAPAGYSTAYVLTQGSGLTIVDAGAAPSFQVSATGDYIIHTLVYDPATLDLGIVQFGTTTGFDVNGLLLQGGGGICAALDVAGAPVTVVDCMSNVCNADAGTITADASVVCANDNGTTMLSAMPNGDAVVPSGYQTVYVLTSGTGLVIEDAGANPSFMVSDTGDYTIHTLVYDPATLDLSIVQFGTTTGFDVNGLLIQGGGSICASLDVAGAPISLEACNTCNADAGTIAPDAATVCYDAAGVMISATPAGNDVVPAGYQTVYVLTSGAGLVIEDAGANPSFMVSDSGLYTIHTLVYDPATLDLSIVQFGVTTGVDVNGLLIQGGGSICASLDVTGAPINIVDCSNVCNADAGTITADIATLCYLPTGVTISAIPDGNDVVPAGYQTAYVLTSGTGLVIEAAGGNPSFIVSDSGLYTIHTLVYDPTTLDLAIVQFGVTTGVDVNGLLIQGGGSICASLDVTGAPINVVDCSNVCSANAGTITANDATVCYTVGGTMISATPDGNTNVPAGFSVIYVLTSGPNLVIEGAGANPSFMVSDSGSYTIHTLVYDPTTLDLTILQLGATTGVDVNGLLIQGGGTICGSLDVAGAQIAVVNCPLATGTKEWFAEPMNTWPMPANDQMTFSTEHIPAGEYTITIIGMDANVVGPALRLNQDGSLNAAQINVNSLEPGTYLLRIEGINGVQTSRIQVIR